MRICPFTGCWKEIPGTLFACRRHWYSLPLTWRARVGNAYQEWLAGKISVDQLRDIQQQALDATKTGGNARVGEGKLP